MVCLSTLLMIFCHQQKFLILFTISILNFMIYGFCAYLLNASLLYVKIVDSSKSFIVPPFILKSNLLGIEYLYGEKQKSHFIFTLQITNWPITFYCAIYFIVPPFPLICNSCSFMNQVFTYVWVCSGLSVPSYWVACLYLP